MPAYRGGTANQQGGVVSNNSHPIIPPGAFSGHDDETVATREVDGEEVIDEDVDPDQVSSIDADRVATQSDED